MKVLLVSHNPISTYQSMGKTFMSLFSQFKKEELCHLYVYPTIPDVDMCSSYFRITDKNIIDSYFHFGKAFGREIFSDEIDTERHQKFESQEAQRLYNRKKTYAMMLARDLMWKFSRYYTSALRVWLEREKPSCIFLAPGEAKFIYDLAIKIAKKLRIPIVAYICDEFYFIEKPEELLGKIQLHLVQKKIKQLMGKVSGVVTICDSLNKQYSEYFGVSCHTIMTGTNYPIAERPNICNHPTTITYMGNLAYNRHKSIADIGRILDSINEKKGTKYALKLYTGTFDDEIEQEFQGILSVQYCGYVTGEKFERAFHSAEILLHTEGFDAKSIDRVKNSISTKIADSLGSGIPLVAYVPYGIASEEYLRKHDCAMVCSTEKELSEGLKDIFDSEELNFQKAENGLKTAKKYHNARENSLKLCEILRTL